MVEKRDASLMSASPTTGKSLSPEEERSSLTSSSPRSLSSFGWGDSSKAIREFGGGLGDDSSEEEEERDVQRARAKRITKAQQSNYLEGRLGLIIDGTGKDYDKIAKNMRDLQQLGYDCYMIFVNTSLDTALQRNKERDRTVPEPIVVQSWKAVQSNLGKFSQLFKRNLVIVDNNEVGEDLMNPVFKQVRGLAKTKVQNGIGRQWIANELAKKAR